MYIGKAALLSGTTVKTIRHYENIGLLPPPVREGKYRVYNQQSVELLMFIKCAQQLGFKLKEMQAILQDHRGQALPWELACKAIADKKHELITRIQNLQSLYDGLEQFESSLEDARYQCLAAPAGAANMASLSSTLHQ
ncbi:MerR family transcriptional regulator [Pseudomonas sp. FP2309]|uniref:MerR family transcriptional regulator n=1 Tax=Pseudomonas sp. FP2309 TaxID=2954091 RepID=UPI002734CF19|nr:MerR family transcriptional regulator [Pseudomonas sp. FP2309]WLH67448.1 MerR family transcriptional regulator [Pseudomonas sp. FP2309]